jgi:hypothetical protein
LKYRDAVQPELEVVLMPRNSGEGYSPRNDMRQCPPQVAARVGDQADSGMGAGTKTAIRLARFGLAITSEPLLVPEQEERT